MAPYPVNMDVAPDVQAFFDEATNTISYIVKDPASNACAVVDSVMDIDYAAGEMRVAGQAFKAGESISIDGITGTRVSRRPSSRSK